MGTICAPAYANIFTAEFEQKYIYPLIKDKSILFLCYIDDLYDMDQIWKRAKSLYEWNESKASLYKVWLKV